MKRQLKDRKNWLTFAWWSIVNKISLACRFEHVEFVGREYLPQDKPFLLVSNHISRWDGLVLHELIGRPSNWVVSPNELKGLQGHVLKSMGCFPADARFELIEHARRQAAKNEGIVIFPEGDIKRDGHTHDFKSGAARIALRCAASGLSLAVVPCAIVYAGENLSRALVMVGEPIDLAPYVSDFTGKTNPAISDLTRRLNREVRHLRADAGAHGDKLLLFKGEPNRPFVPRVSGSPEIAKPVSEHDERQGQLAPPQSLAGTRALCQ